MPHSVVKEGLMKNNKRFSLFLFGLIFTLCTQASTQEITPAEKSLIAVNNAMFGIYDYEHNRYQKELLNSVPVIVARFSTEGGHFTLYRPGHPPLVADFPSVTYQLAKSVGHSIMVTYDMLAPYVQTSITDKSWRPNMTSFQAKVRTALENINALPVNEADKQVFRQGLTIVDNTLSMCLHDDRITNNRIKQYIEQARPLIPQLIKIGSSAQVERQMKVISSWKKLLGHDWDKTYAMTNTIYVARQNNMIFSMLAEWMGKEAINHRLFLFETTSFTTSDEDLLHLWSQIMFDRILAQGVFGDYYLMDSELIANGGRDEILKIAKQYGLPDILPDLEPFNSTGWPWRHNPNSGKGPASLNEESDFQFKQASS